MARKPTLSVVKSPDEPPAKKTAAKKPAAKKAPAKKATKKAPRRLTVSQAAESGVRRDLLVSMRDRIAKTVESPDCPPRDLAALTRRLTEIAKDIEAIDLAARQEEERSGAVEDSAFDASAI